MSAILFNCALDVVFEDWKTQLQNEGLYSESFHERLTNTRYADDILIYAKSLDELQRMIRLLLIELEKAGLHLNFDKTKILHTSLEDENSNLDFVDINENIIQILHPGTYHRYLGRRISVLSENRN